MEQESLKGQQDQSRTPPPEDITIDLETTHELTQRGSQLLEMSKELNSSSKALLEEIEPII